MDANGCDCVFIVKRTPYAGEQFIPRTLMNRDDPYGPEPVARWYLAGAIASFLLMALACWTWVIQTTTDPATLPADQRQLEELIPWWQGAGFAVQAWAGLAGAVGLLLRRRWAEPLLAISLAGTALWFSGFFLVRQIRETMPAEALGVPAIVCVAGQLFFRTL